MPHRCQQCDAEFDYRLNFSVGRHPFQVFFHRASGWVIVVWPPCFVLMALTGVVDLTVQSMGTMVWHVFFAFVSLPSLILYALGQVFPMQRRVECIRCGWSFQMPFKRSRSREIAIPDHQPSSEARPMKLNIPLPHKPQVEVRRMPESEGSGPEAFGRCRLE